MSENVELQQIVVDRVIIEMRRDRVRRHIIRRMLYRCKGINLLSDRKDNDASRMLSGRPSHANTALHDPVDLTVSFADFPLLIILFYITEGCLVRERTDRPGTERLTCAKNNFGIFMCLTLIITGEIQVDIRLLISLKSKEGLKRDVKPILFQRCPALRAYLIRHIAARHSRKFLHFFRIKITVMTVRTDIMRAQWINLRDTRHRRNKRRADRSS